MSKQSIFEYARIAAEAEGRLLKHFDPDAEQEESERPGNSGSQSGARVLEDTAAQSDSLMAFSTLGQSYMRDFGDPVDPSAFLRTL